MTTSASSAAQLDVRQLTCEDRFALIFTTFGRLPAGGALELINDHDPKPLRHVFDARHPGTYSWKYLEQGPALWRVAITRTGAAPGANDSCCGSCGGH